MARKKISEYSAKSLVFARLGISYSGIALDSQNKNLDKILPSVNDSRYVVKVDEGVKGRMKKGLVKLNLAEGEIQSAIDELSLKGYSKFLIEEFLPHGNSLEKYFSLERTREGIVIYYSRRGGIDIEANKEEVRKDVITEKNISEIANFLSLRLDIFHRIIEVFDELYFSFLEVNPLVVTSDNFHFLDLAVEVDSSAEFFVREGWTPRDFVEDESSGSKTFEEINILKLKAKSQAAFSLTVLNPDGSIWMCLSGGGASIVLADEAYNQGYGEHLANYGEYSGNPNQEETYIYTLNLLRLLLKSKSPKKALVIGGGVANFTDIKATFRGVIKALDEVKNALKAQEVKVFVRRGGPNQEAGLGEMKEFLENAAIVGGVWDPSLILSDVITKAIDYLNK